MTSHRKITAYRLRKQCRLFSESNALVPSQQLKLNDLLLQGHWGTEDGAVMMKCCFKSTETVRFVRTGSPGRPPRLSHSSSTQMRRERERDFVA